MQLSVRSLGAFLLLSSVSLAAEPAYQKPPADILAVLHASRTPMVSVNPSRTHFLLLEPVRYPDIADVAQPMVRLAGLRIDVQTNGLHLATVFNGIRIQAIAGGPEAKLALPAGAKPGIPTWSPDGKHFAFPNTVADGIELWVGETANASCRRIAGVKLNGVRSGFGQALMQWLGDNRTLLLPLVPSGRGIAPAESTIPRGPHAQESLGNAGPAPTFQDMLSTPHDEALFDHYATSQLALIDTTSGAVRNVGKPAIFTIARPSPDLQTLLVGRLKRPYSYQLPASRFPEEIELWDRSGTSLARIADLPLAERIPLQGVRTGPRSFEWRQDKPATLVWVEALDGGNPKETVPHRERMMELSTPFQSAPRQVLLIKERYSGMTQLAAGQAIVDDYDRQTRIVRTMLVSLDAPSEPKVLFSLNERDAYRDPGNPVLKTLPDGRRQVIQQGDEILMSGAGASARGEHPFVDRLNLATGKTQRLFQADGQGFEAVIAVLDESGTRLLTRRESATEPPNFFLREGASLKPLTHFPNPAPQTAGISKQLVTYKRADGVPLSFTLYLPPGYQKGTRLPALVWAYPFEFSDNDTAGQVTGHDAQSFPELSYHQLPVLHGYALLDNASMPIVGDPDTVNNTYIEQLQMNAQAAIDKAVEMGVVDGDRVGVFGHSYGAFMTANLLAHTKLFRAGVAESGAYNRTLTPFGFQSERRTFWEAPDVYTKISPFWHANQIKSPLLLIHGEADDNTGTFPVQSERMYSAVRGNGGTVRLVMLPAEAHGYRARQTIEHVLFEELTWFDRYLKQ